MDQKTPSTEALRNARGLLSKTLDALSSGDFSTAESAGTAFLEARFDHFKIRRAMGFIEERRGDFKSAEVHVDRAMAYKPGDPDTWFQFMRIKSRVQDIDGLSELYRDYPQTFPGLFAVKIHFYKLQTLFEQIREQFGSADASRWLSAGLELPETRAALETSLASRQAAPARHARPVVADDRLLIALDALEAADPVRAIKQLSQLLDDESAFEALNTVIPDGPDAGHPVWHVVNPHFHLWAAAELGTDSSQTHWQSSGAIRRKWSWSDVEAEYLEWSIGQEPSLARELVAGVAREIGTAPTILDLGCGTGNWLRFFAEHCEIPIGNIGGVELHESRAACAREGLIALLGSKNDLDNHGHLPKRKVISGDLLNLDVSALADRFGIPDLVTMFVVTGCFDDTQLAEMLASVAALRAPWLMTTSVRKRWELWHGRDDEEDFFERIGYHPVHRFWDNERLNMKEPWRAMGPRSYWVNRSMTLYRHRDAKAGK